MTIVASDSEAARRAHTIGVTYLKSEVRFDLRVCLETVVASEAAKRAKQ